MKFKAPRGTFDILPEKASIWQFIENSARKTFDIYNYKEIRTPIFESTDLFARSIGSTTDIVTKEMYTFEDKKGRSLTLRPEETASVVRSCLENNLISADKITKLYYLGPMFRYERPQAGRFRQFHQIGIEVFGTTNPLVDAEVIIIAVDLFNQIGLKGLEVDINSVGCADCRPKFQKELKEYFKSNVKNMCEDCRKRVETNPLRILDCKNNVCEKYIQKAPASLDFVCNDCKEKFNKTIKALESSKISFQINNRLVRGLDYYTGVTFEVVSKKLGAQNAICGGGRYNNLVKDLGGKQIPAVGFALGIERVIEVLKSSNIQTPEQKIKVFIAAIGDKALDKAFLILQQLRKSGISSDIDYIDRSLKASMKAADKSGAEYVLIIGEDEIKKNSLIVKKMSDGSQREITLDKLSEPRSLFAGSD